MSSCELSEKTWHTSSYVSSFSSKHCIENVRTNLPVGLERNNEQTTNCYSSQSSGSKNPLNVKRLSAHLIAAWIFWEIRNNWLLYLEPILNIYQSLNRLPIRNSQNCSMFSPAFVAGSLQGYWWSFISRNYVVRPIFYLMNIFIALKETYLGQLMRLWYLSHRRKRNKRIVECIKRYSTTIRPRQFHC